MGKESGIKETGKERYLIRELKYEQGMKEDAWREEQETGREWIRTTKMAHREGVIKKTQEQRNGKKIF